MKNSNHIRRTIARLDKKNPGLHSRVGCNQLSLRRYRDGEREIPFITGWNVLREAGEVEGNAPDLAGVIGTLLEHGHTRASIASRLGVDSDTIGMWYRGLRTRIDYTHGVGLLSMLETV